MTFVAIWWYFKKVSFTEFGKHNEVGVHYYIREKR